MNKSSTSSLPATQRDALEARFALGVCARLGEGAQHLPHDIGERLRVARQQAIEAARTARQSVLVAETSNAAVSVKRAELSLLGGVSYTTGLPLPSHIWHEAEAARSAHHDAPHHEPPLGWGWRLALLLPVVTLVAGLWGIQRYQQLERVEAATTVDLQLLTDELPPDAYADPGFEAYLNQGADPDLDRPMDNTSEMDSDLSTADGGLTVSELAGAQP